MTSDFIPGLATHWALGEDKKHVYFKLNEKAKWSDGEPITAKDYLFLLDFMRSENIQAPWYNNYYEEVIDSIRRYDDYTISIHLKNRVSDWELLYTANVTPLPSHYYSNEVPENYLEEENWRVAPTVNPYLVTEFKDGEYLRMSKVEDWWGYDYPIYKNRYNIESHEIRVITGGTGVAETYFLDGQLDSQPMILPEFWYTADEKEPFKKGYVERFYYNYDEKQGFQGLFLNTASAYLSDRRIREGLAYSLNFDLMLNSLLRGDYSRANNVSIGHKIGEFDFDDTTIRYPEFDPTKAGELFSEAGFDELGSDGIRVNKEGLRLSLEVVYGAQHHSERLALLKEEAKKAGLELQLKQIEGADLFKQVLEKKFQVWWGAMSTGILPAYWQYLNSENANKPQTNNFFNYASPEMDELVDQYRTTFDFGEKAELSQKIERLMRKEVLLIPWWYLSYARGGVWRWIRFPSYIGAKIGDSSLDGVNPSGGFLWIDEEIKKETLEAMKKGDSFPPILHQNTRWATEE